MAKITNPSIECCDVDPVNELECPLSAATMELSVATLSATLVLGAASTIPYVTMIYFCTAFNIIAWDGEKCGAYYAMSRCGKLEGAHNCYARVC